jgi:hypothetical protein
MMPVCKPSQRFSACWAIWAMRVGSQAKPDTAANARATAISSAADDDRPEPMGTLPLSTPSQPDRV